MATACQSTLLRQIHLLAGQPNHHRPDSELLQAFAAHRYEAAFETLIARHGPMVLRVCRRVPFGPQTVDLQGGRNQRPWRYSSEVDAVRSVLQTRNGNG
jgi:hypothetical protein